MPSQDYSSGNKRIAKNTLVIYGQLMLRMFLGLFTSRLALEALGVSDFGLNSVVGGVVVLFTFISNSLSGTTIFLLTSLSAYYLDPTLRESFPSSYEA